LKISFEFNDLWAFVSFNCGNLIVTHGKKDNTKKHVIYIHPELQQCRCGYQMKVVVTPHNTLCYCTKRKCKILVANPKMRTKPQR
jgi:hypothetical protein